VRSAYRRSIPEQLVREFESAFNATDIDRLLTLYQPDAAFVPQPGTVVHGTGQIRAALTEFLALRGQITIDPTLLVLIAGDVASVSGTWRLDGTAADGKRLALGVTTADVACLQPDGSWRFVIDNPWGNPPSEP
jgi:uncharacterized protein (TIGR02246 family)